MRLGHPSPKASFVYQDASAGPDQKIADGLTSSSARLKARKRTVSTVALIVQVGQGEAAGLARTRSEAESRSDPLPAVPYRSLTMK